MQENEEQSGTLTASEQQGSWGARARRERCTEGLCLVICLISNKRTIPSFSDLPFSKSLLQNIPHSHQLSSEASPASGLQTALPHKWQTHQGAEKPISACMLRVSQMTVIRCQSWRVSSKTVSSNTVGIWENLAGGQSRGSVEARAQWPRKLSAKAKKSGLRGKKLGHDPQLLYWHCKPRPFTPL